jgi:hypothetical protein
MRKNSSLKVAALMINLTEDLHKFKAEIDSVVGGDCNLTANTKEANIME